MKFVNRQEKIDWLKSTAQKLSEMEQDRRVEILKGNFGKAFSLLKGINFARAEFRKVSSTLKNF